MNTANILFLYATQAEAERRAVYVEACRALATTYGHQVVFCYNGPKISGMDDLRVEHFDTWVQTNRSAIGTESLEALEKRFPASNLWRAAVIERALTDYSFLGGSRLSSNYSLPEIEWYLKALVLFYDDVLERHRIDVAFNQVSDNIHAHVIYELARSKKIIPLSLGRGIYWFDDMVYPQTELNFSSPALRERYHILRANPAALGEEHRGLYERELARMGSVEAKDVRPEIVYTKTHWSVTRNAITSLRDRLRSITLGRPSILRSNDQVSLLFGLRAYLIRVRNLTAMRTIVRMIELPKAPFVFFPLHYQPEATLLASSPGWLDQLALIRLLSASLPAGYRLVVKDHPLSGGMRPPSFYRSAQQLKNVVLLDERLSGRVIANTLECKMVATIGGTVGLEAMLNGKPVLMFGGVYYDCMDTILRPPADLNDLPNFLKQVLVFGSHPRPEQVISDARTFLHAWISIMQPAGRATYWAQDDEIAAGKDWARIVHEMSLRVSISAPPARRS